MHPIQNNLNESSTIQDDIFTFKVMILFCIVSQIILQKEKKNHLFYMKLNGNWNGTPKILFDIVQALTISECIVQQKYSSFKWNSYYGDVGI